MRNLSGLPVPLLALTGFANSDSSIEFSRLIARDAQRFPMITGEMFGEQNNLADVMRVVRYLAIDGLHYGMRFAPYGDGAWEIHVCERFDSTEETGPAALPLLQESRAGGGRIHEFAVAVAIGLFTVRGQKVGPTRTHVARHVLHDNCDRVGLIVEHGEELLVGYLLHRALGEPLVIVKDAERIFNIRSGELE